MLKQHRFLVTAVLLLAVLGSANGYRVQADPAHPPTVSQAVGIHAVGNPIPRSGNQKMLVILADFPDRAGLFSGQQWQQFFFGPGGFRDYFLETSYNQLVYSGDIAGISAGTPVVNSAGVAYVRMPNPISYYANGNFGFLMGPQYFPRNNGGVVMHALFALDQAGFDFSPYANPATQQVENLLVVFAGQTYAVSRDPENSLEATAYALLWAAGQVYVSTAGQTFNNFTFCPEIAGTLGVLATIGVCAHEHGHALGMFDLYDYSYTTTGAGNFDLMAYGTFGASLTGQRPYHLGAFSKTMFGWVEPVQFGPGSFTYHLPAIETSATVLKFNPRGQETSKEYFLLENRQPVGFDQDWVQGGLCPGLVIWHVDENILEQYPYKENTVSLPGSPPHPGVIVVEADGRYDMIRPPQNFGECSDTWAVGSTWNAFSTATSNLWDGTSSGLTVTVVSHDPTTGEIELSIHVSSSGSIVIPDPKFTFLPFTWR
jgi:M6 family metalloprotease-like protein